MSKINPEFTSELKKFGADQLQACYNCGNCTAVCSLSTEEDSFPREMVRFSILGLTEDIESSLKPWSCYYCGECTDTCPRQANPAELMMSLRRWLTSVYDWTGLSKLFYTKKIWELIFIFFIAAVVIALFVVFFPFEQVSNFTTYIGNKEFVHWVEIGDWTMAIIVGGLLISNIFNMWHKVILKPKIKVPFLSYFKEFWNLIWHFLSQIRLSKCEANNKKTSRKYWISHLLLMTGYSIMFAMIVVMLPWFQTDVVNHWYHPQRLLGYYATFGLLFGLTVFTIKRLSKKDTRSKYSHFSDWTFIVLLFLTTITGILVNIFRLSGFDAATFYVYIIHLAVLVPMIMVEVPFSKWSHLAYRPFAIYFDKLKKAAADKKN